VLLWRLSWILTQEPCNTFLEDTLEA
jgi:hypothetical protein